MNTDGYKYDYAVVIPVFENNGVLLDLVEMLSETFNQLGKSYQLILVDDSKSNQSWQFVQQIYKQKKDNTIAIRLSRNYGQHNATLCGFQYVNAPWVVTMDDDLEIFPNQIPLLIQKQRETDADVVSGSFKRKKSNAFFNLLNKIFVGSGEKIKKEKSTKSSFRLICKRLTDRLLEFPHHFIFIDRVLMWYTQAIEFVEVAHFKSQKPISGYQKKGLFSLATNILFFFSSIPIKAMSYVAFALSIFTFAFGLFRVYAKVVRDLPMGYTSIIVTILFSTSLILFALGLIGEYLRRIYSILNNQPAYEIKSILK